MDKELTVISERVDDIPLLLAQLERMGLGRLLDAHFPVHGNRSGLSLGAVAVIWLVHILSQGDHRLNHVRAWVEQRLQMLRECTGESMRALDFTDDRLADLLRGLSEDVHWHAFETALTGNLVRVYDLPTERVRLDGTSASSYRAVVEEGLFQFGHSKDHRPDLPQLKVMLATLDPLGMPLVCDVTSGEKPDDPLYVPAIARVREGLGQRGLLYVGDCKMAAIGTRAFVHFGGDFYLCPLSAVQLPASALDAYLEPVWGEHEPLTPVYRGTDQGEPQVIAEGYERFETVHHSVPGGEGAPLCWEERRLVVRSLAHARSSEAGLRARLSKAHEALVDLNRRRKGKRPFRDIPTLQQAAEGILTHYSVTGLLQVEYVQSTTTRSVRRYGAREATQREEREALLSVVVDEAAVSEAVRRLGWRVYVTNQPQEALSLEEALLAYRGEYVIERGIGRLKGAPLSLTPMYLSKEEHVTGLVRLLSLGVRVLTLVEFTVRRRLAQAGTFLAGLYAGNPMRKTAQPTTERLLQAFDGITLSVVILPNQTLRHLTPLSQLQQTILALMDLPISIYEKVCSPSTIPT
jgi:transposase